MNEPKMYDGIEKMLSKNKLTNASNPVFIWSDPVDSEDKRTRVAPFVYVHEVPIIAIGGCF